MVTSRDVFTPRGSVSIHFALQAGHEGEFFWACFGHDGSILDHGYAATYQYALTNANIALVRATSNDFHAIAALIND